MTLPQVTIDDFQRVEMRVGRILSAEPLLEARKPAYKLRIDFGVLCYGSFTDDAPQPSNDGEGNQPGDKGDCWPPPGPNK